MKHSNHWLSVKEAANKLLSRVYNNARSHGIEDKVSDLYSNNLHKALQDIAVWAFKNPIEAAKGDVAEDLTVVRNSLINIDEKGEV